MIGGVRILEDRNLVDTVEDWSAVRSPGRARRRRRLGHPQNIVLRQVPKPDAFSIDGGRTLLMHPETARKLRELVERDLRRVAEGAPGADLPGLLGTG